MDEIKKPKFYTVLPADVRYDSRLSPLAKILYSEIVTLSNKTGVCFATNRFFAKAYGYCNKTIAQAISDLHHLSYVTVYLRLGPPTHPSKELTRIIVPDRHLKRVAVKFNLNNYAQLERKPTFPSRNNKNNTN
jgi:hypothetical protein